MLTHGHACQQMYAILGEGTRTPKNTPKPMKYIVPSAVFRWMLSTCAALIAVSVSVMAQSTTDTSVKTTTDTSVKAKDDSDIVNLSPFMVTASENEKGYRTEQTLIGSRTAANLMDLPGSVSIINREQIDDLNATEVHTVL